jgi:hypothetical protein
MLVIWDSGVSGDDGLTVTVAGLQGAAGTTGDARIAGVIQNDACWLSTDGDIYATQDVDGTNWVWLQTYGRCNVNYASPITAGKGLACGAYEGEAFDLSTDSAHNAYGFFYDNATGSTVGIAKGTVEAFIRCE